MKRLLAVPVLLVIGLVAAVVGMATAMPAGGSNTAAAADGDIPPQMFTLYRAAAATCPGLPWTVLAAVGKVESDHGRSTAPGVHGGENSAGAAGPMQFLAGTWAAYGVDADGDGRADRYDPADAIYGAARYLCANGAGNPSTLRAALYAYNHAGWYVDAVLHQAASYAAVPMSGSGGDAGLTLAFAFAQVGTPYEFGGTGADGRFDCSGLTQAAWAAAGVKLPRTSEEQWLALPHIAEAQLQPGDLVFFNPGEFRPGLPGHVGLYIGNGYMVDAPHTGALVRIEPVTGFGQYAGAARP